MNDKIDRLPPRAQVVIDSQIERLGLIGPDLGLPYTSQMECELRELGCHCGADLYRILYRRSRNLFVPLYFLEKRAGKVPAEGVQLGPGSRGRVQAFKRDRIYASGAAFCGLARPTWE